MWLCTKRSNLFEFLTTFYWLFGAKNKYCNCDMDTVMYCLFVYFFIFVKDLWFPLNDFDTVFIHHVIFSCLALTPKLFFCFVSKSKIMHFQAYLWLYVFVTDLWVSRTNKGNVAWTWKRWVVTWLSRPDSQRKGRYWTVTLHSALLMSHGCKTMLCIPLYSL